MPQYVVATSEKEGFQPRGAARKLFETRNFETIIAGPAETGKTWAACQLADCLLWKYPGAQGVLTRSTYAALVASAVRTYQRIIGINTPISAYGGEKPQWFDYPNGSRLWLAGLDNPGKILSTERDFFCVNQAEELTEETWDFLGMRATGRGAVMPYTRVFGDCNPGPPSHWIKHRPNLLLLESRHEENPTLFDSCGNILPQGERTLGILDNLTGIRYDRYRLGKWVQAEGAVYDQFDRSVHVIPRFEIPASWRRIESVDFGYTNPFVCQWWAIDHDGRMYLYREIYKTQSLVQDMCSEILAMRGNEQIEATVADHDAEDRATMARNGIPTYPAQKAVAQGIQLVNSRLRVAGDGKPRLFILEGASMILDSELKAVGRPYATEQEFESYVWSKEANGRPNKEEPIKEHDHGMDAMRYAVAHVDGLGYSPVAKLSNRTIY